MKSLMILSCVLLCIGSIQGISIPPERPFGPPPPLQEEPSSVDSSAEVTTEEPVVATEEPSSSDETVDNDEEMKENATLVKVCVEMFVNGKIPLPQSTPTTNTTPSAVSTTKSTEKSTITSDHETVTTSSKQFEDEAETTTENVIQKDSTTVSTATTTTATGPAILFSCNFEHGWCGIEQDSLMDQFNWTLADYPTPSSPTGPDRAYSGTHYIFIEATRPELPEGEAVMPDEKADILLPPLSDEHGEETCLQFKFHMFGFHIRELQVYLETSDDMMRNRWELVSFSGDQGNLWHHAQINFFRSNGYRVGFIGVRGLQYSGDIALDDIMITSGFCDEQNLKPSGNNEVH